MRKLFITLLVALVCLVAHAAKIGTWRSFASYNSITRIEQTGNQVYVLASGSLYRYNTADQSVNTYDKVSTLSDCNIAEIKWNKAARRLLVLYSNGNIDLIDENDNVLNVSDYYSKALTDDKTVTTITMSGKYAYIGTGFGVLKMNVQTGEFADTYNLGMKVNDVQPDVNGYIYAATDQGVYRASMQSNLVEKTVWTRFAADAYRWIFTVQGTLYGANFNTFARINTATPANPTTLVWQPVFYYVEAYDDRVIFYGWDNTYFFLPSSTFKTLYSVLYRAISYDSTSKTYWVSSPTDGTLSNISFDDNFSQPTTLVTGICPDGPKTNDMARIHFTNGVLGTVPGYEVSGPVQFFDGTNWTTLDDSFASTLGHKYLGHMDFAYDPTNASRLIVVGQTGVYEFRDGKMTNHWGMNNSLLRPVQAITDPTLQLNYTVASSVTIDSKGTAWITNPYSGTTSLLAMNADGTWTSYHHTELLNSNNASLNGMRGAMIDSRGLLWFVNNYWDKPAVVRYNPTTDEIKVYDSFINQDGTSIYCSSVTSVAEDLDHNIWVGTTGGPAMLRSDDIVSGAETFYQPKIPRNDGSNLADYLLSNVAISAIAIDGAGRKWFGTNGNGAYLISADNLTQLQHFTSSDTPLPSDMITDVAIDGTHGEVFFATDHGLCSYMSDASEAADEMTKDNVYAYPNPVRPDYDGLVTVTGLSLNADVKIVSSSGALVAEGRSSGGTFTWDATDKKGRRVASGVYMVQTATSTGGKGTVCKIAVVN